MEGGEAALEQRRLPARARVRAHWSKTWRTCVASQTPATSTRSSSITSASVPRIGPAVSSGVAIRTRRRAAPIRLAIRCESSGPRPGQNQGRTPSDRRRCRSRPTRRSRSASQSCSKLRVNAAATRRATRASRRRSPGASTSRASSSSSRSRRAVAVADDVLVVHQVAPARDRLDRHAERLEHVRLGRAAGRGRTGASPSSGGRSSWLKAIRTRTPRAARGADRVRDRDRRPRRAAARRRVRGRASARAPASQATTPLGDGLGGLAAVGVRAHVEHGREPYPGR